MTSVPLTFACLDYDRMRALQDGRVRVEGVDLSFLPLPVEETFYRQLRHREFDLSEMSLSSYVLTLDFDDPPFIALPVFPSRYFRHQTMFISERSGIVSPQDLIGKRVGIPEFQMTASVWQRGILEEHYGVPARSMKYFTGGLEQRGRREKIPLSLPAEFDVSPIGADQTLSAMLLAGEIDAIFSASEPSALRVGTAVRRLFPDYPAVEAEYFQRTGIFPIMHVVVLKREVHQRMPWIAGSLVKAFDAALAIAKADLHYRSALKTMLPWLADHVERTEQQLGPDYWSYGLENNRHALETFLRYSFEQGLARKLRTPDDLFPASTSDRFVI